MSDRMTVISTEFRSYVEITQNAKQEFTFSIKVYGGDLPEESGLDIATIAQKKAVELARQTIKDIKNELRPKL